LWASASDEEAVIRRVTGSESRQCLEDQGGELKLDALPDWKPVQPAENWRDVIGLPSAGR